MKPWDLIGWLILGAGALLVLGLLLIAAGGWAAHLYLHLKTRNIQPEKGQEWNQEGSVLHIKDVTNEWIIVEAPGAYSTASWGESLTDWRERVRNRRLFLVRP